LVIVYKKKNRYYFFR